MLTLTATRKKRGLVMSKIESLKFYSKMVLLWLIIVGVGALMCLYLPPIPLPGYWLWYPYSFLAGIMATAYAAWRIHLHRNPWQQELRESVERTLDMLDELKWKINESKVSIDIAVARSKAEIQEAVKEFQQSQKP